MNYYRLIYDTPFRTYETFKLLSLPMFKGFTLDENDLLNVQLGNVLNDTVKLLELYRVDRINPAGEVEEVLIYPNKELEQSLLLKKQKHWN